MLVYLKDLTFHRLKKIKEMYKQVLDIDFENIGWFFKAIDVRHHCVHRDSCNYMRMQHNKEINFCWFINDDFC
jgi:plasmid replication initiation protein